MATEHHQHHHQHHSPHGHGAAPTGVGGGGGKADGNSGAGGSGSSGGGVVGHHNHKSFKRKYRKLKLRFDHVMKQSDDLFKKDIIATAQVKRITEENVRLLDTLLELNNSQHLPRSKRYNIGSPSCSTPVGFLSPEQLAQYQNAGEDGDVEVMDLDPATTATNITTTSTNNIITAVDKKLHSIAGAVRDSDSSEEESPESDDEEVSEEDDSEEDSEEEDEEDEESFQDEYDQLSEGELGLEKLRQEGYGRGIPTVPLLSVRRKLEAKARRRAARREARVQAKIARKKARNGKAVVKAKQEANTIVDSGNDNGVKADIKPDLQSQIDKPRILFTPEDLYMPGSTPPYLRDPSPFLLSVEEEEEYYNSIEQHMALNHSLPHTHNTHNGLSHTTPADEDAPPPTTTGLDEHTSPRNPMSVYSWLKRNQPQIFLQEVDEPSGGIGGSGGTSLGLGLGRKGARGKSGPKKRIVVNAGEGEDEDGHGHGHGLVGGKGVKRKRKGEEEVVGGMGVISTPVKGAQGGKEKGMGGSGGGSGGRGRKKKEKLGVEEGTPVGKKVKK